MDLKYLDNIAKNSLGDIKIPTKNNWNELSDKIKTNNFSAGNSGTSQFASKLSTFFTSKITLVASIVVAILSIGTWFVTQNNANNKETIPAKKCVKVETIPVVYKNVVAKDSTENLDIEAHQNENQENNLSANANNIVAENDSTKQDSTETQTVVVRRTKIIDDTKNQNDSTENN